MSKSSTSLLVRGYEVVIGFETHAQLFHAKQNFQPCAYLPSVPSPTRQACGWDCAARHAAGDEQGRGRACHPVRAGRRGTAEEKRVCLQNYFYLTAQGLPDQPVRNSGGTGRLGPGSSWVKRKIRPPGAAHLEEDAAKACTKTYRAERHRPELRWHAAAGNRDRARHAFHRRGRGLRQRAAQDRDLDRHLRRQHARGLFPLMPTCRCKPGAPWVPAARSRT